MKNNSHFKRAASVIVLSLLMAFVLGLLGGNYLWSRFGPHQMILIKLTLSLAASLLVGLWQFSEF